MTMMPEPQGMAPMGQPTLPPMPSSAEIEQAQAILDAVSWEEIEPILRTDERRNYSINIETDSTAFKDEEADKQQATEFMGAMTAWLERAIPGMQANPSIAPLFKELTMMYVGKFKPGRTLEEAFEDAFEQVKDTEPQPNPDEQKLKAEMAMKDKELQASMAEKQADAQLKAQESQQKMAFEQQKFDLDKRSKELELAFKGKEMQFKERELQMKAQNDAFTMQMQQEGAQFDRQARQEEASFNREVKAADFNAQQSDRQFQRGMQEREFAGKDQDRAMKADDMAYRRQMDAEAMKGPDGKTARDTVMAQVESLVEQVAQAVGQISEQQMMIAQALQGIAQQQDETTEALTSVVSHMTAPRKVRREGGRAVGVEVGPNEAGDLRTMMEKLAAGRSIVRGADNRIEAFA